MKIYHMLHPSLSQETLFRLSHPKSRDIMYLRGHLGKTVGRNSVSITDDHKNKMDLSAVFLLNNRNKEHILPSPNIQKLRVFNETDKFWRQEE